MGKPCLVAVVVVLTFPLLAAAQEMSDKALVVQLPVLIESPMRTPSGLRQGDSVSLVIGLHGGGGTPDDFKHLWDGITEVNFIYLSLRAPYPIPDQSGYEWAMWAAADSVIMRRAGDLVSAYVESAIEAVSRNYDVESVFLVGFSQGAIYTYVAGMAIPSKLDGILVFGGPGLLEPLVSPFIPDAVIPDWISKDRIRSASSLRVFMAHGRSDSAVVFSLAQGSCDVLEAYGYEVTFRGFDGGHRPPPTELLREAAKWIVDHGGHRR